MRRDGRVIGSSLLAQGSPRRYFHPRPSARGRVDAAASGTSNLGSEQPGTDQGGSRPGAEVPRENRSAFGAVPVDAVTTSGSGLDPDISVANARLQAARVARARGIRRARCWNARRAQTRGRQLGFFGEATVNVLDLNLALDRAESVGSSDGPRHTPHLSRCCARRGQDVRHVQRGGDAAPRDRRRGRLRRDHGRENTEAQLGDLERSSPAANEYRGTTFEEMDLDAVLARRPAVALVDELAHTNVPGCRNEKRWQDAEELLAAGIDVISTVNIQHLESLNDVVEAITGIEQRETIPDAIVRAADQVELVDMTPEALRRRMAHGNIYRAEKVDAALSQLLPGRQPRRAARTRADVGRGSSRRSARRIPRTPWHQRRVGDPRAGGGRRHGRAERRGRGAASRPHGMRTRGELLGVHVRASDGLAGPEPERLAEMRPCSPRWVARTARSAATTWGTHSCGLLVRRTRRNS